MVQHNPAGFPSPSGLGVRLMISSARCRQVLLLGDNTRRPDGLVAKLQPIVSRANVSHDAEPSGRERDTP